MEFGFYFVKEYLVAHVTHYWIASAIDTNECHLALRHPVKPCLLQVATMSWTPAVIM